MRLLTRCLAPLAALTALAAVALAQNGGPFAPRLFVNDMAITNYELDQRAQMLTLFRAPGDPGEEALKALIDDRLRLQAAKEIGIVTTPENITTAMTEFAARANLSAEEFVAALAQAGVSEESFRDFVEAGFVWREVVRARFGPLAQPTEAQVDRAIANARQQIGARLLVSEIVIPVVAGQEGEAFALAERLRRQARTEEDFAALARQFSRASSAGAGGRIDWRPVGSFAGDLGTTLLATGAGKVSPPQRNDDGSISLYFVRQIEQTPPEQPNGVRLDYARVALPPGQSPTAEAARITASVDTCNDLYTLFPGASADQIVRETQNAGALPSGLAAALQRLDAGEGTAYATGGRPEFLMLCARTPAFSQPPLRNAVRNELAGRRLSSYAENYLEELRSEAILREP